MAKPDEGADATMIRKLAEITGRALEEWTKLVRKSGLAKHGQVVKMLKTDHGVTHGYANLIAHKSLATDAASLGGGVDLVDAQYAGDKAALRPIYDRILDAVSGFGADVQVAPKKGYVSLRRKKQFALVQPSTKTRIDVGIKLEGEEPRGRLEASGSFNAMVSHRVKVGLAEEVDGELIGWLREAYQRAG
jgi:hypothetical protein